MKDRATIEKRLAWIKTRGPQTENAAQWAFAAHILEWVLKPEITIPTYPPPPANK